MNAKVNSIIPTQSFMSIPEVQLFLGIKSRKTILKYITSGKLNGYKIGGTRWRIAAPDVTAFLKAEFNVIGKESSSDKKEVKTAV